jgi:hypothetical protein
MPHKVIYRDYRKGHAGQFASRESYNRARAQGVKCHIHREYVNIVVSSLAELGELEDRDDLEFEEFHATGDTGE